MRDEPSFVMQQDFSTFKYAKARRERDKLQAKYRFVFIRDFKMRKYTLFFFFLGFLNIEMPNTITNGTGNGKFRKGKNPKILNLVKIMKTKLCRKIRFKNFF